MLHTTHLFKNIFVRYLVRFAIAFSILFFGTEIFIGVTTPGNYYLPFLDQHFDYIDAFRQALLSGSQFVLSLFNYDSFKNDEYILSIKGGGSIRMVYSCLGYGIMSVWAAFIFAGPGTWKKKAVWITAGLLFLFLLNIVRVSFLLVSLHHHRTLPFQIDHHTWYNLLAYSSIILLMFAYEYTTFRKIPAISATKIN